jgi:hypothetical protein
MPIVYVSLVSRRKISISDMDKKGKALVVQGDDLARAQAVEKIGDWLAKQPGWEFMCSSSCNHPKESGFRDDFDVGDILSEAVNYAYGKLAIRIEPGPVTKAPEVIEAAVKSYKYPGAVPLLFVRSGKDKKDILLWFKHPPEGEEEGSSELDYFIIGLKYAANLCDLRAEEDRATTVIGSQP